jgi:hypothetical protein
LDGAARIMKTAILNAAPARNVPLHLGRGQHTWLHAAKATQLRAVDGITWITIERGTGDVVVLPKRSFTVAAGATALIGPLHGPVSLRASGVFDVSERNAAGSWPSGHGFAKALRCRAIDWRRADRTRLPRARLSILTTSGD